MNHLSTRFLIAAVVLTGIVGATIVPRMTLESAIVSQEQALRDDADWGTFFTYFSGESYGTKDALAGVAVIKPGREVHPPHQHAEEEYLIVTEGSGVWVLNGVERVATAGDMLYAAPWDVHGISNTGAEPMTFVVWKWNNKGVPTPVQPD